MEGERGALHRLEIVVQTEGQAKDANPCRAAKRWRADVGAQQFAEAERSKQCYGRRYEDELTLIQLPFEHDGKQCHEKPAPRRERSDGERGTRKRCKLDLRS